MAVNFNLISFARCFLLWFRLSYDTCCHHLKKCFATSKIAVHDQVLQKMGVGAMTFPCPKLFHSNEIQFDRINVLGRGGYSCVFRGFCKSKKQNVAVKRMELTKITESTEDEYKHHAKLSHENVVIFVDVLYDDNFRYIILELCTGSLLQVIEMTYNGPTLPPDNDVLFQIANGLDYIHSQNLIHFDVKPENILISTEGKIKLADFGLCKKVENGFCILINPIRGTHSWMAPEILPSENNRDVRVSAMADVFSCGLVFIVFLTRKNGGIHPFGNWKDDKKHVQINIRNRHPVNSDKIRDLPLAHIFLQMIESIAERRMPLKDVKQNLLTTLFDSIPASQMNQNTFKQTLALANPAVEEPNLNITTPLLHRGANNSLSRDSVGDGSTDKNCMIKIANLGKLESNQKNLCDDYKEQAKNEQRDHTSPV